jgi:hypothetical protein
MTPAVPNYPRTATDLLFGSGANAPQALARQITSATTGANLDRALRHLPQATREAAVREAATTGAALLDVDLTGLLLAAWRTHRKLVGAARSTLAAPGSTELVDLTDHQVTTTQQPSVEVLVDGRRVATLHLSLSIVFDVSVLVAGIKAGRLVALHSGRCDVTATLTIQGTDVLTKSAHLDLPGVIPLTPGIRLLPAEDYPAEPARAGGPADRASRVTRRPYQVS